jgi:hypothetical protein
VLDEQNLRYTVQHKRVIKHNESRIFTHIHVADRCHFELTVYTEDKTYCCRGVGIRSVAGGRLGAIVAVANENAGH